MEIYQFAFTRSRNFIIILSFLTGICQSATDAEAMDEASAVDVPLLEGHVGSVPRTVGAAGSLNSGDDVDADRSPLVGRQLFSDSSPQHQGGVREDVVVNVGGATAGAQSRTFEPLPEVHLEPVPEVDASFRLVMDSKSTEEALTIVSHYVSYSHNRSTRDAITKHYAGVFSIQEQFVPERLGSEALATFQRGEFNTYLGGLKRQAESLQAALTEVESDRDSRVQLLSGALDSARSKYQQVVDVLVAVEAEHKGCSSALAAVEAERGDWEKRYNTASFKGKCKYYAISALITVISAGVTGVVTWVLTKNH